MPNVVARKRVLRVFGVLSLIPCLSGCVAAAIVPLALATGGLGLSTYKLIQTESGGSLGVDFPAGPDGKAGPPKPLPPLRRVAVWPGDTSEVRFAQKLEQSKHFTVVAPASMLTALKDVNVPTDLNKMTDSERDNTFIIVCQRMGAEAVFAARNLGTTSNTNIFSLSRANVTSKAELITYSCAQKQVIWKDQMALVIAVGASNIPNTNEIAQVAGDAWAERILQASGYASFTPQTASSR